MTKILIDAGTVQQALEALAKIAVSMPYPVGRSAIAALRTAIEAAEKQEPVAWANINKHGDITHTNNKRMPWSKTPLYTTPPAAQRQPLTDEEIERACVPLGAAMLSFTEVARAIEAAHGITAAKGQA